MKKLSFSMVTILLAVMLCFTGVLPMNSAKAAYVEPLPVTTIPELTIDYILDGLGDALNYGLVAREYHQDNHAETSVCVDVLKKTNDNPFLNTSKTYSTGKPYTLYAAVSAPNGESLEGMQFALCTRDGSSYTILEDTIKTVESDTNVTTVGWNITTGSELLNETLYVRRVVRRNGAYRIINEGTEYEDLTVTYGPKVVSASPNSSYIGKMVCNFNGVSIKYFDLNAPKPSITFGKDMDIGYYDKVYTGNPYDGKPREYTLKWVSLRDMKHVPTDDQWFSMDFGGMWMDWYTYEPVKVQIRYMNQENSEGAEQLYQNFEDSIYYEYDYDQRKGVFYWGSQNNVETYLDFEFTQETDRAHQLLLNAEDVSIALGNMEGGTTQYYDESTSPSKKFLSDEAFKNTSPSIYGNSTVTGPVDANGNVVSLYTIDAQYNIETQEWEMNEAALRESIGYKQILIAPNEYVVFNVVCPGDADATLTMLPGSIPMYVYEAGKEEQATWPQNPGDPVGDTGSSDRVIFNFVYWDETEQEYLPYEGTIRPASQHGGTLLAPKAYVKADRSPPNGAIIADSVFNTGGTEIHQRTLTNPAQGTWVHMVGEDVEATGYIKVEKLNSSKEALNGVTFGVYSDKACEEEDLVATETTGTDGIALFDGLEPGTYYVKEISVPEGYVLDLNVYTVEVVAGVTKTVGREGYLVNFKSKGYLRLTKVEEDKTSTVLPGTVFKLYTQEGDVFNENTAKLVGTYTTDVNGKINVQLEIGEYWLKEEKAPFGYAISDPSVWKIEIKPEETTIVETEEGSGVVTNAKLPFGTLKVTKIAAEDKTKRLSGAVFTVYRDPECEEELASFTTGYDGVGMRDLPVGNYWVKETKAPDGYEIGDAEAVPITINEGETKLLGNNGEVTNEIKKGTIYLYKVEKTWISADEYWGPGKPLAGARFTVYTDEACTNIAGYMDTDSNGYASLRLSPGSYWVKETIAPAGYKLSDKKYPVNVYSGQTNQVWYSDEHQYGGKIPNEKLERQGRIRLYKENEEGERLNGAKFQLFRDPQCEELALVGVYESKHTSNGEDGKLEITGVPYGTYYLKEVEPPAGYELNDTAYKVVVNGNPSDVEGDRINKDDNKSKNVVVNKKKSSNLQLEIPVKKVLEDGDTDETFTFKLEPAPSSPPTAPGPADGDQQAAVTGDGTPTDDKFGVIEVKYEKFVSDDVYNTKYVEYGWLVYEEPGEDPNIVYDDTVYWLVASVVENENSELALNGGLIYKCKPVSDGEFIGNLEKTTDGYTNIIKFFSNYVKLENPTELQGAFTTADLANHIIFTNKVLSTSISVTKEWPTGDNGTDLRGKLTLHKLAADGTVSDALDGYTPTRGSDGNTYTWEGLPKYEMVNGQKTEITYVVKETRVPGYKDPEYTNTGDNESVTDKAYNGGTIKNTLATTDISVEKVWEDDNNAANTRPASITLTLWQSIGDQATAENVTETYKNHLTAVDNTYTWSNLPKYTVSNGTETELTYYVTETQVPGYAAPVYSNTGNNASVNDKAYNGGTIINAAAVSAKVEASKQLNGAAPANEQFSFTLTDTNTPATTLTQSNDADGMIEFTVGPFTEIKTYYYTLAEVIPDAAKANNNKLNGYTYDPATYHVEVVVSRDPQTQKLVPSVTYKTAEGTRLDATPTFANTYEATGTLTVPFSKELVNKDFLPDDENHTFTFKMEAAQGSPASGYTIAENGEKKITFNKNSSGRQDAGFALSFTAANTYVFTVTETDSCCAAIQKDPTVVYTVKIKVVDNKNGQLDAAIESITKGAETVQEMLFVNTYQVTDISVKKVWDDNNTDHSNDSIQVQLYNGTTAVGDPVVLNKKDKGWEYSWSNLPMYAVDADGNATLIDYNVDELSVPDGYVKNVVEEGAKTNITNTLIKGATGKLTINKTVQNIGTGTATSTDQFSFKVERTSAPEGAGTFEDVTANLSDKGSQEVNLSFPVAGTYVYKVHEIIPADDEKLPGYTYDDAVYTVTFVVTPDNAQLKAGTPTWTKTKDGQTTTSVTSADFVNKYGAVSAQLTATKVLQGEGIQLAAEQFSFELKDPNGEVEVLQTKSNAADGTVTFDAIEYKADGEYKYTISEKDETVPEGYVYDKTVHHVTVNVATVNGKMEATVDYAPTDDDTLGSAPVFTNKYGMTQIEVTKIWDDANNQDGKRPESITIRLWNGTEEVRSATLSATGEGDAKTWPTEVTFDKLPMYDSDGQVITYTVTEDKVTDYSTQVNNATYTITNTYAPGVTSVSVEKVWSDSDNVDGLRPGEITVNLLAGGVVKDSVVLDDTNSWKHTFESLAAKNAGQEIVYTVEEVTKDGEGNDLPWVKEYSVVTSGNATEGYKITNTHTAATTEVSVEKVWSDSDNVDGLRPSEITVNLLAGGVVKDSVVLDDTNRWKHTFANLAAKNAGQDIVYTVEEVTKDGEGNDLSWVKEYTGKIEENAAKTGYIITNTREATKISIKVTKTWVDDDNKLNKRPDSIAITLLADGNPVGDSVTLTKANADANDANTWTYEFIGLPLNKTGSVASPITYTITETAVEHYDTDITGDAAKGFAVTNTCTYAADGNLHLEGVKKLTGDVQAVPEKTFAFGIYKGDVKVADGYNTADGKIVFGTVQYTQNDIGATYLYTVKEIPGPASDATYNYTYDETVYSVSVNVTDDGEGGLAVNKSITKNGQPASIEFTNAIKNKVGHIGVLKVDKKDTAKGLPDAVFGVYSEADCNKESWKGDIRTGETGAGSLMNLPIGTYYVQESVAPRGYLLDDTIYTVVVVEGETAMVNGVHVTNTKLGRLMLEKSDRLNPDKKLPGAVYTLYNDEACLPEDKVADITTGDNGIGSLEGVPAGTYWVKETKAPEGYEVDPLPYKVVVAEDADPDQPVFVQVSDFPLRGALTISKTVVGVDETTESFLFDIELSITTADPIVGSYEATLNGLETAKVPFAATEKGAKATVSLKSGETLVIRGLRDGVTYTVTEQPNSRYDVQVNGAKAAMATGTIKENAVSTVAFQNTLKLTSFTVEKVWQGAEGGEIQLTLFANGVQVDPQPEYTKDGNKYAYADLPMVDEKGQEIVYTVKETAMAGYTTSYKNIAPYADKTDCAYNGGQIINQALTSFSVKKEWAGLAEGEKAPAIQLTLYCNGTIVTKETPKPDAKGWYVYNDLPATVEGKAAVYTVKEEPLSGYATTYINKGEHAAVTDCAHNGSTIVNSKIPQTGDGTPLALWMTTMLLAALGLVGLKAYSRKREN